MQGPALMCHAGGIAGRGNEASEPVVSIGLVQNIRHGRVF